MKKVTLAAIAACVSFAAAQASAQVVMDEASLKAIDTNGNGTIEQSEFDTFAARSFDRMDKNNDRMLSADELNPVLKGETASQLDRDGDGMVSRSEFGQQMTADFKAADKDGNGVLD